VISSIWTLYLKKLATTARNNSLQRLNTFALTEQKSLDLKHAVRPATRLEQSPFLLFKMDTNVAQSASMYFPQHLITSIAIKHRKMDLHSAVSSVGMIGSTRRDIMNASESMDKNAIMLIVNRTLLETLST
jgi:hypothetical protein